MTGLGSGLWGVLFPDEDDEDDEDDDEDDGGLRNKLVRNALFPELGGTLFLKAVVSGVLWRGLEK